MQFVSYEFEYFYQCIMTFWGLKDSGDPYGCIKPIKFKLNNIDPKRRFVNLFEEFSPLCGGAYLLLFSRCKNVLAFHLLNTYRLLIFPLLFYVAVPLQNRCKNVFRLRAVEGSLISLHFCRLSALLYVIYSKMPGEHQ